MIAVLTLVVMGHQLPPSLSGFGVAPASLLIAVLWVAGIYLIGKSRNNLPWQQTGVPPDSQAGKRQPKKRAVIYPERPTYDSSGVYFRTRRCGNVGRWGGA